MAHAQAKQGVWFDLVGLTADFNSALEIVQMRSVTAAASGRGVAILPENLCHRGDSVAAREAEETVIATTLAQVHAPAERIDFACTFKIARRKAEGANKQQHCTEVLCHCFP